MISTQWLMPQEAETQYREQGGKIIEETQEIKLQKETLRIKRNISKTKNKTKKKAMEF